MLWTEAGPHTHANKHATAHGIRVVAVRLSAQDFIIDLRYQVTDAQRAKALITQSAEMLLIHERTGTKLAVPNTPKVGRLRQTSRAYEVGRIYFALFSNPGRLVQHGDLVTLTIGDVELGTYRVQ